MRIKFHNRLSSKRNWWFTILPEASINYASFDGFTTITINIGWLFWIVVIRGYSVYCKEDTNGDAELSKDKDGFYWSINTDEYEILRIDYVHTLQHLLRLCDVEKELTI